MAAKLDLSEIKRGDDYAHELDFVQADETSPFVLTGRTYRAHLRETIDDTLFTPLVIDTTNALTGIIVLRLVKVTTVLLEAGMWHWDLEETVTNTGYTTTLFEGRVPVSKDVTR